MSDNGFNDIEEFETKRVTAQNIGAILEHVKKIETAVLKVKDSQKKIQEDLKKLKAKIK